jgi:hypothetical protein
MIETYMYITVYTVKKIQKLKMAILNPIKITSTRQKCSLTKLKFLLDYLHCTTAKATLSSITKLQQQMQYHHGKTNVRTLRSKKPNTDRPYERFPMPCHAYHPARNPSNHINPKPLNP